MQNSLKNERLMVYLILFWLFPMANQEAVFVLFWFCPNVLDLKPLNMLPESGLYPNAFSLEERLKGREEKEERRKKIG